jgi:galactoside O-acetyltransferase
MNSQSHNLKFQRIGEDVTIWPLAKIISPETISIGNSVIIDDFVFMMGGRSTTIGNFVHIASFVSITGGGECCIEDFAGISSGSRIFTGDEDYLGGCLTGPTVPYPYRVPIRSFVHIRKHAVLGANSVLLPGVEIGEGAVVGANSLVTKNCEPWSVYVGSPAGRLKSRPKSKILELDAQLRATLFSVDGKYLPKRERTKT